MLHRLRDARKAKHLTQQDMADYLNCHRTNYNKIERGVVRGVSVVDALLIARKLDSTIEEMFGALLDDTTPTE